MKKLFFLFGCGLSASIGYGQAPIQAGTVALTGGVNYTSSTTNFNNTNFQGGTSSSSDTFNSLQLSTGASYFVADNWSVGLNLLFATNSNNTNNTLRLGPVVQRYQMLTDQFGFTGALGAGYSRDRFFSGGPQLTGNGFYANLTPGIIFLPIPKLGLGASIGGLNYNYTFLGSNNPTVTGGSIPTSASSFGANFGLNQLTFSGTYFFGR